MEFLGRIFGLSATLIIATMFLLVILVLASADLLDEAGRAFIALVLLPVNLVGFFVELGRAVIQAF